MADGPFTVTKNTPLTLTAAQLVGNDIDPDTAYGDKLKVVSWGGGNHVSVVVNGDGSVTVTPETGYTGAASFVYRVGDSAGATSGLSGTDATVSLDIKAAAVGVLTVLEPVTDNYKDTYNTPDNIRENRTYLQIGAIKANGVTYTLTNPPPNGKIETGFTQLAVQGSDGSSGFVTLVPADSNVVTSLRRDYVTAYHPKGSFGPLLVVNTAQLKTAPIKIDLVLTVKNAEVARATLEYRYEDAIYNAPKSNIEYNGPGGRWYVAGTGAPLNWETAGAP
ncbi:cadherin-like domain-containing protein [Mycolicibacterium psychrotolerans]|uniref:cadherin-like domain-containing protein n=1 Tax=Mycolicibacterium psychrotolerans TaxID=216929 RepID=UPI003D67B62A